MQRESRKGSCIHKIGSRLSMFIHKIGSRLSMFNTLNKNLDGALRLKRHKNSYRIRTKGHFIMTLVSRRYSENS